jgi:hypothetical protein
MGKLANICVYSKYLTVTTREPTKLSELGAYALLKRPESVLWMSLLMTKTERKNLRLLLIPGMRRPRPVTREI